MNRKRLRWVPFVGVAAAVAGMALGGHRAIAPASSCPEIGTLIGIGIGMLVTTTVTHALVTFAQVDLNHSGRISTWCGTRRERHLLVIVLGVLITAASLLFDVVLWAWVYRVVGAIQGLAESLYFSGITFTTFGYGDITLMKCWQLLSVGEAINGVLMAGWSTALLIFIVQRAMTLQLQPETQRSDNQFRPLNPGNPAQ